MARNFNVQQAEREKVYPKIGIFSPAGGGKTYTSLRLASGMVEETKRLLNKKCEIWLANNEGSRGKYYANEFKYKIIELKAPHEPELYYDLIDYAESYSSENDCYVILLIDSLSKEWGGEGGCIEIANRMGGQFQNAWKNVSPRHRRLMDKLVDSNLTIIATMRGEDQYEVEEDNNGKKKIVKLGVGAKQGKDFEYEFTCTFSLDQKTNCAESFKDNTHLFENKAPMKLTEQDGANLIKWANTSQKEPDKSTVNPTEPTPPEEEDPTIKAKTMIGELAANLTASGVDRKTVSNTIKDFVEKDTGKRAENYNKMTGIANLRALYKALTKLKPVETESENTDE